MRRARAKRLIGRENIDFGSGARSQGDGCLHAARAMAHEQITNSLDVAVESGLEIRGSIEIGDESGLSRAPSQLCLRLHAGRHGCMHVSTFSMEGMDEGFI